MPNIFKKMVMFVFTDMIYQEIFDSLKAHIINTPVLYRNTGITGPECEII